MSQRFGGGNFPGGNRRELRLVEYEIAGFGNDFAPSGLATQSEQRDRHEHAWNQLQHVDENEARRSGAIDPYRAGAQPFDQYFMLIIADSS